MTTPAEEVPDKSYLYGVYQAADAWRDKLARRMAHKALDIPADDMNITTTTTTGVGARGLIGTALAAGLPAAVLAGLLLLPKAPAPIAPAVPGAPTSQAWDAITEQQQPDGTWKEVKRERLK